MLRRARRRRRRRSPDKYAVLFEAELKNELIPLEQGRLAIQKKKIPYFIGGFLVMISGILLMTLQKEFGFLIIVGLIICVAGMNLHHNKDGRRIAKQFKEIAVRKLVELEAPGFSYEPDQGFSNDEIYHSGLFYNRYSLRRTGDLITGTLKGVKVGCCNAIVVRPGEKRSEVVFNGIWGRVQLPHDTRSRTVVISPEKEVARFFPRKDPNLPKLTAEKDPVLFDHFRVYSDTPDQVDSVLTTDIKRVVNTMDKVTRGEVQLSIMKDKLYFTLNLDLDLFEADLDAILTHHSILRQDHRSLCSVFGIMKDLVHYTRDLAH